MKNYEYELEKFHASLREKRNEAQKVMEMDSLDFLVYRYNKAAERLKDNALHRAGGPKPEPLPWRPWKHRIYTMGAGEVVGLFALNLLYAAIMVGLLSLLLVVWGVKGDAEFPYGLLAIFAGAGVLSAVVETILKFMEGRLY
jgi:hypothetical protein